jgi:LPXTG-motif cell wall-anchored protein
VFETKSRNSITIGLYNDAIKFADSAIYSANLNKDTKVIAGALNQKAKAYYKMKNYDKAVENNEEALKLFKKLNYTNEVQSILEELVKIYNVNGNKQKLTTVFEEYLKIKDKVFNEQVAKSITAAEIKYETELKEAQIKSQQLELGKEKTNRNIAISGIGFLLLLSGGGFWFFKNRQKQKELHNQNTLLGLQQNLNAMELQSLNKQLDPHEIKNLLASISPEIQEKAPESYRKMLKLFNITKASLNSHSLTESIENQIQQTEDFLSLEKKFGHGFHK